MIRKTLIIYHASCADGFTAAWIASRALGDVELLPAQHGDDPPDVTGRDVYILDFSYSREMLQRMHDAARFLTVIDHHKTAQEALHGLDFCIFDMDRCGAMLAWRYFNGGTSAAPRLVEYVQDRDLWRWELPDSKPISAWIRSFDFNLDNWDALAAELDCSIAAAATQGQAILRAQDRQVAASALRARVVTLDGLTFPAANCTENISEVAGLLATEHPSNIGACWFCRADDDVVWSLRSRGDNAPDVSAIAKARGGGGHHSAAGFRLSLSQHVELLS